MSKQNNRGNRNHSIIRTTTVIALALALSLGSAFAAAASQAKPRSPEAQDNASDTRDDASDLRAIVNLVDDWHDAHVRADQRGMATADAGIKAWLAREVRESAQDMSEAAREARYDRTEIRKDRRDYVVAVATGHRRAANHERAELRDDRQELREDRADVRISRLDYSRTRSIASELSKLETRFDRGVATRDDYERKSALLKELQKMARAELSGDRQESREDRR